MTTTFTDTQLASITTSLRSTPELPAFFLIRVDGEEAKVERVEDYETFFEGVESQYVRLFLLFTFYLRLWLSFAFLVIS